MPTLDAKLRDHGSLCPRSKSMKHGAFRNGCIAVALLLAAGRSHADDVQCKDYWHTNAQWEEMKARCEEGVRKGDPLSQVAVAIHLLDDVNRAGAAQAEALLLSAAQKGYDDAFYWLGMSQTDKQKSLYYLEQAQGSGALGLMALVMAAEIRFKGDGIPRDFDKARAVYKRAYEAAIRNFNNGIPKPPGEWWSNAKWFTGANAVLMYSERYGYESRVVDGKQVLVEIAPHPELSDKELSQRQWKKVSGVK